MLKDEFCTREPLRCVILRGAFQKWDFLGTWTFIDFLQNRFLYWRTRKWGSMHLSRFFQRIFARQIDRRVIVTVWQFSWFAPQCLHKQDCSTKLARRHPSSIVTQPSIATNLLNPPVINKHTYKWISEESSSGSLLLSASKQRLLGNTNLWIAALMYCALHLLPRDW